jgi:hypothetical protein
MALLRLVATRLRPIPGTRLRLLVKRQKVVDRIAIPFVLAPM